MGWRLFHPSTPCCRHKSLSGMAGAQETFTPLEQTEALALGHCILGGLGRALGSGWAPAEALRLFLFSYKQDRTQSSIKLKNKKKKSRKKSGALPGGGTRPPRPCSDPPPVV